MPQEGYIKFDCRHLQALPDPTWPLAEINTWRRILHQRHLLGEDEHGVGFGNISLRWGKSAEFIVTGTRTGGLEELQAAHLTRVVFFDLDRNQLTCQGPIQASSEALSHGVIYHSFPSARAVVHVHHLRLWQQAQAFLPMTAAAAEYGTPAMAREVIRVVRQTGMETGGILVMGGHTGGLLAFDQSLEAACNRILMLLG